MRELIIKYLFGKYYWKLPDKSFWKSTKYFKWMSWFSQYHYNETSRGAFWYYNGFLLIGLIWLFTGRAEWIIQAPMIVWFLFVLYMGFPLGGMSYWEKHPAQWDELDEEQKWYYGNAATSGDLSKAPPFSPDQFEEWAEIRQKMRVKYRMTG